MNSTRPLPKLNPVQNSVQLAVHNPVQNENVVTLPPVTVTEHGLICKENCECSYMNGMPFDEKIKTKLYAYLKRCVKSNTREAEVILSYDWVLKEIFDNLMTHLPRSSFFKLCRIVHFSLVKGYKGKIVFFIFKILE